MYTIRNLELSLIRAKANLKMLKLYLEKETDPYIIKNDTEYIKGVEKDIKLLEETLKDKKTLK